jgi:hypothetical protein
MSTVRAILAFMQGVETYRRRASGRLSGSPFMLRLHYLGGHLGIWQPETFWVGRVGNRLRLVDHLGDRSFDLPLDRISGVSQGDRGELLLQFEPTCGLHTTLAFRPGEQGGESYHRLLQLMLVGA